MVLSEHGLFGIYTCAPETPSGRALIMLNSGMLDCTGPYRLHVDLAERLVARGIPSLRMDQSGKGETPLRGGHTPSEAALADFDDAFAFLQRQGVGSVVLFGICSGAIDALWIASQRPGVSGLVLLDGYYERTVRSVIKHYGRRIFAAGPWNRAIRRMLAVGGMNSLPDDGVLNDLRDLSRLEGMQERYRQLLDRGVAILSVFSGDWRHYNYEGQLEDFIGGPTEPLGRLTEVRNAQADHVYTLVEHRERLLEQVVGWVRDTVWHDEQDVGP